MYQQIVIQPANGILSKKKSKLYTQQHGRIVLNEKGQTKTRVHAIRANFYKILENAN